MRTTSLAACDGRPHLEALEPRLLLDGSFLAFPPQDVAVEDSPRGIVSRDLNAGGPDGYLATGPGPVVVQDTEGQDAVWVYGSPVEATIQEWAGGQYLNVSEEAGSYVDEMGWTRYEAVVADVMLWGPGGALGTAGPLNLTGPDAYVTVDARGGLVEAILLADADGDLFGMQAMPMGGGMMAGQFTPYEAPLTDPMMWTLLGGEGDGELDLAHIVGLGVRVSNGLERMPGLYGPALDVDLDNLRVQAGMPPETTVLFREAFEADSPDGYLATGPGPVVVQDTEGQDAVWVYGSPVEVTIQEWAGGQYLNVHEEAGSYVDEMGWTRYEAVVADVMLWGPGGALGTAGPLNLTGPDAYVTVDARGGLVEAILLADADGDLFGMQAMPMGGGMMAGQFTPYEAPLTDPMMWTLLGGEGDGELDLAHIVGLGVRVSNGLEMMPGLYGPALDVDLDNLRVEAGMPPETTVLFREAFEAGEPGAFGSVWTGSTDDSWEEGANWAGAVPQTDTTAVFSVAAMHQPALYGDASVKGADLRTAGWAVGGAGHTLTVGAGGIDSAGTGTNTVEPDVVLGTDSTWTVDTGNALNLNGALSGGDNTLTKDGAGTLILGGSENRVSTLVINGGTVRLASGAGPLVLNSLSFGDLLGGLGGSAPASPSTARGAAAPAAVVREVAQADVVSPVPTAEELPVPVVTAVPVLAQPFGMPLDVVRAGDGDPGAEGDALAALVTLSTAPAVRAASAEEDEPAENLEGERVPVPLLVVATPAPGVPPSQPAGLDGALVDVLAELALEVHAGIVP